MKKLRKKKWGKEYSQNLIKLIYNKYKKKLKKNSSINVSKAMKCEFLCRMQIEIVTWDALNWHLCVIYDVKKFHILYGASQFHGKLM